MLKWFLPDASKPSREYRAEQQRWAVATSDAIFRIAEMLLVCGAVVYLEQRASVPPIASTILSACVAMYARGRISAGMLEAIEEDDSPEERKRVQHLIANGVAFCIFVAAVTLTAPVVEIIVANQP
ncbi:hypothetical protein HRJ34_26005 [Rhizorhabdus wittichii]|uniref:Uncharacterized protein n=1 Tax=Rhizorhabdus wittichii TaxID=160791 RepID=A0A975D2Z1_9SPHN|nr:hypothetical protein [Rhizorhabdus wittichii]QTH21713.1 hypothetical protein HRJ34_26005 [Rhizorhabdus wittichii]